MDCNLKAIQKKFRVHGRRKTSKKGWSLELLLCLEHHRIGLLLRGRAVYFVVHVHIKLMSGALAPDDASYRLGGLPPCRYGEHPVVEPLRKIWSNLRFERSCRPQDFSGERRKIISRRACSPRMIFVWFNGAMCAMDHVMESPS